MLRGILNIALLHIKLTLVQRSVFFFSLLMPIVFTALMSQANFGDASPGSKQIDVVNEDNGNIAQKLIDNLKNDGRWSIVATDRESALAEMKKGKAVAIIGIKADFSEKAIEGKASDIELQTSHLAGKAGRLATLSIRAAIARTSASINAARALSGSHASGFEQLLDQADASLMASPAVITKEEQIAKPLSAENIKPSGANQSSPGMLVMFAMLFMAAGTNIIIHERRLGTLRRLMVMPISKKSFLFGKLLGIYALGLGQMALLIIAGALLFRVDWGSSPLALIVLVLSFGLVNTSLGIMLAVFVKTTEQANALASMAVLAFSALGGAWWPLNIVPSWMRVLGHILPTAWAMDGFHDIIIRRLGLGAILLEVGVLLILAVIFLSISAWRFRYS